MNCPRVLPLSYNEFSQNIHAKAKAERIPVSGAIELTFRCNLHCCHCYCSPDDTRKEMSYRQVCRILDEIADAGCLWLLITGGEPLLRDDFLDIYSYAKKKGMIITLFTNGTLISPYIVDYLKSYPPFMIEISLYGITSQTYEIITGVKGSFRRCLEGIDILRKNNLPLRLKTMVMTLNQDEVVDIERFADSLGLEFRLDALINPRLNGDKEPCKFRVSPEKVVEFDLVSKKRTAELMEFCSEFVGPPGSDNLYLCGAGTTSFHIDPYGYLSLCEMARIPSFNLAERSFKEYWYNNILEVLSQKPKGDYPCGRCDLISLCSQCPGWAQLEHGDPEKAVEYLCRVAHLRAAEFRPRKQTTVLSKTELKPERSGSR